LKFTKIKKKEYENYDGYVYDLTVEESHSYNIDNLIVHNSGAGSLVCYTTNITKVDPLEYDLLFERFLNPDRGHLPDVDADFCINNGYKVFDYLNKKYGKEHCCNIITFQRLQTKAIIKDLARALEIDFVEVNNFTKTIPDVLDGKPVHIKDLIEHPQYKWFFDKYPVIKEHAIKLEGIPKSNSQHPAGIGIVPQEITDLTPVIRAKEEVGTEEMYLSSFEKQQCEDIGIVKYDILRLSNISDIKTMVNMINLHYNMELTEESIPLNDKKTWELISSGKTLGVFQFASPLGIDVVTKIKPNNIEELAAANAFIRPGASGLPEYIAGKQNYKNTKKIHPKLDKYLKKTFGSIVYQEQIMQLISELMGISFGQADIYRRALEKPNKGKNKKIVDDFNNNVVEKATQLGFSKEIANSVRKLIIENSGYGFNKCLSGSEYIYGYSDDIKTLYNKYQKYKKNILLKNPLNIKTISMDNEQQPYKNTIKDIQYSGFEHTFEIVLESFKTIKATKNHKFPIYKYGNIQELTLDKINKGDYLFVYDFKNNIFKKEKILRITIQPKENVYDITMQNPYHNFIINNGILTCNSHAVCYSIISYWTAWMKINYPLIFYTVMLNSCKDSEFALFIQEAKNRGITINPPNINKSKYLCTIEDKNTNSIRIGLKAIKGVGPAAVQCIEEKQPFKTLNHFFEIKTSAVNKKVIEVLSKASAFSGLGIEINNISTSLTNTNIVYLNNEQLKLFFDVLNETSKTKTIPKYAIPVDMIKGKILNSLQLFIEKDNTIIVPEDKLNIIDITLTENDKKKYKTRKTAKSAFTIPEQNNKLSIFEKALVYCENQLLNVKPNIIKSYIDEMKIVGYSFIEHPCIKYINKIYDPKNPTSTFNDMEETLFMVCGIINDIEEKLTKNNKKYYLITLITPVDTITMSLWENQYKQYENIIKQYNIIKSVGIKKFGRFNINKLAEIKL